MKTVLCVFMVLLVGICTAQERKTEPFKGCNKIVIVNEADAQTNFKNTITILLEHGYSIESKDEEYHTIKTQPINIKKSIITCFFNILAKDSCIVVTGMFNSNISLNLGGANATNSYFEIVNKSLPGSDYRKSFNEMVTVSGKFPGTLYYELKP